MPDHGVAGEEPNMNMQDTITNDDAGYYNDAGYIDN